jgi:putative membrane protein
MRRTTRETCHHRAVKILIRVLITALALGAATWFLDGIKLSSPSEPAPDTAKKIVTLLGVAVIFGLINAFLKPIIKTFGCVFYILTLGLFALVVNALLLELTSRVADKLKLPFYVDGFTSAFWGAIIVGVVSWLLNWLVSDD